MCDARGRGGQAAFCSPFQSFHRGSSQRSACPCSSSARARRCWPRRAVVSLREDQKIFFVLGNAGSGKGTQCAKLVKKFALDHVSAGDLLRAEVASGSERGAMIAEIIKDGRLVPGHITIELLKAAIEGTSAKGVLVDGFPRDIAQAEGFVRDVSGFEFALYFDCPEEELMRRLLKRGETSGRVDDNKESIRKRFKTFEKECKPVVDMYGLQRKIYCVDAVRGEDDIFADLCRLFETAFADREENAVLS